VPNTAPLIPDAGEKGFEMLRRTGIFPINHTVVVKNHLLGTRADLAPGAFNAFAEAKRVYVQRLKDGAAASASDQVFRRVMEMTGDPLPYGIEPNRKALEAIVQHSVEQGILTQPFAIED